MILEALEHAEARGATILAELVGYGATADASHITLPAPGGIGAVRAARRALEKAGLTPDDIDHVNAHATSTPGGRQGRAPGDPDDLRRRRRRGSPITANKSMLGHTLGAAGAIEAIATILAIRDGCVPPTINLVDPDPEPRTASTSRRTPRRRATSGSRSATRSGSAARTPRSIFQPVGAHDRRRPCPIRPSTPPGGCAGTPVARARRRRGGAVAARRRDVALLALIDRLADLLDRSDLTELEVESGGDRAGPAQAVAIAVAVGAAPAPARARPRRRRPDRGAASRDRRPRPGAPARPSVKAPLTGIFYASPAPGSAPYVQAGGEVAVGQVIGLIEAMKLFNEIKSDLAGRVVRVVPESGTLVKAKQPLIEVEPL